VGILEIGTLGKSRNLMLLVKFILEIGALGKSRKLVLLVKLILEIGAVGNPGNWCSWD
jgi:hypothetical protein